MTDPEVSEVPCPDPETLALLLEGGLRSPRRRRLLAHIGSCDGCYEVFTGAARFELEERARQGGDVAERTVVRSFGPPALAAAALAATLCGVLVVTGPSLDPQRLEAGLARQAASVRLPPALGEPRSHPWSYARRAGEAEIGWRESFRIGVLLSDWAAASSAAEPSAMERVAADLRRATAGFALEGVALEGLFGGLGREASLGARPAVGFALAAQRMQGTAAWEAVRLGAWAESARLAAVARDRRYFLRAATSRPPADVETLSVPGGVEARLAASLEALHGAADEDRWSDLTESLSRLVAEAGRYATEPSAG